MLMAKGDSVLQRHAKDVCLTLAQAFDAVYQKSSLDKEMASSGTQ